MAETIEELAATGQMASALALLPSSIDGPATRRRVRVLSSVLAGGWLVAILAALLLLSTYVEIPVLQKEPGNLGVAALLAGLAAFVLTVVGAFCGAEKRRLRHPHAGTLALTETYLFQIGDERHGVFAIEDIEDLRLVIRRSNDQFGYGELKFRHRDRECEIPLMSLEGEAEVVAFCDAIAGRMSG